MNDLEKELLQTLKNFALQYEEDKRLQAEETAKLVKQIYTLSNNVSKLNDRVTTLSDLVENLTQSYQDHPEHLRNLEMKRNKELDQFKTQINLVDYAQKLGYQLDKKKSSTNCIVLFDNQGDKILVGLDKNDNHYFYYSLINETDKGSIIDFVQKRKNLNLGQIRKELRPWINNSHSTNYKVNSKVNNKVTNKSSIKLIPTNQNKYQIIAQFESFQTINNHPYLNQRGINQNTINNPRFKETIYQDKRNNVIFLQRSRRNLWLFHS